MTLPTDCAASHDLHIDPGPSWSRTLRFMSGDPLVPLDVSNYSWSAIILEYEDSTTAFATFAVDDSQANVGLITLSLAPTVTDDLVPPRRSWWRLIAVDGATVLWPIEGHVYTDKGSVNSDCDVILQDCDVVVQSVGIGVPGPSGNTLATFSYPGDLAVTAGTARFYAATGVTIQRVIVSVGVAAVGSSVIVDVNKNNSTIYTTQANRPTIPASQFVDLASPPDDLTLLGGDFLTVDIDQVGSATAGKDLTVQIEYA